MILLGPSGLVNSITTLDAALVCAFRVNQPAAIPQYEEDSPGSPKRARGAGRLIRASVSPSTKAMQEFELRVRWIEWHLACHNVYRGAHGTELGGCIWSTTTNSLALRDRNHRLMLCQDRFPPAATDMSLSFPWGITDRRAGLRASISHDVCHRSAAAVPSLSPCRRLFSA